MRHLLIALVLFFASAAAAAQSLVVDVQHYAFQIGITDENDVISGEARVTVQFRQDDASAFELDLIGPTPGMTVLGITSGESPVSFVHDKDVLSISVAPAPKAGDERTYTIRYEGEPADGLVISTNKFGDRTFFGDNWPNRARHWLPAVDHPSDKATVEFIVSAPDRYQVIGTGELVEETDLEGERRRTHWRTDVPIPTKVAVFGAARFAVEHTGEFKGIPIQAWVYPQDREAGFYDFSVTLDMLEYFEREIGPYPYEKLANVQSTTRYGGMENATNIFYDENAITGQQRNMGTVAHEIAHQWFGDSVSEADWQHIWLSEGFATYFTQLYMEAAFGVERIREGMARSRDNVLAFYERRPNAPIVNPAITDPNQHLNANSYQKGAWVLHMLRHTVGDENFWKGIRAYYETYRDGNATSEDFQKIMEEASGQDLGAFFRQWLYQAGQPMIEVVCTYDEDNKTLHVQVEQIQNGRFVFPLELGIVASDELTIETLFIDQEKASFDLAFPERPDSIRPDPETWLLASIKLTMK